MDYIEFKAFDNLNTEIIILDGEDFKLLWINDAAKAANWIGDSSKFEGKTICPPPHIYRFFFHNHNFLKDVLLLTSIEGGNKAV